ncbi:MAG TPA: hypothetical protein PKK12_09950, partial [Candidatus Aminicenantes bacterium]|nr:hypothetical protein [Candidatus Aminicenantes bacterium]
MSSPPPLPPETGPFEQAADTLGLTSSLRALLERPAREFTFAIPVRLDDGLRDGVPHRRDDVRREGRPRRRGAGALRREPRPLPRARLRLRGGR